MAAKPKGNHVGFAKLKGQLAHRSGVTNPSALAASIGRKKLGAKTMASLAAKGKAKARPKR